MHKLIQAVLNSDEKKALHQLIDTLSISGKRYFLRNEIQQTFAECCHHLSQFGYAYHSSSLSQLMHYTHEIILDENSVWLVVRPWIASQQVWRLTLDLATGSEMTLQSLLDVLDRQVNCYQPHILNIDFQPFYQKSPVIDDPRNIGQGLAFLNRYLCNKLLTEFDYWLKALFNALHVLEYDGMQLLINDRIQSGVELSQQVKLGLKFLGEYAPDCPYKSLHLDLQALGFEPGWGNTASRTRETLELLNRLIEDPEPAILEAFVARVPAVFRVVLISINGWVSQESVLGRPEIRSQVDYVLEQARSLENQLQANIEQSGLELLGIHPQVIILTRLIPTCTETQCALPWKKVEGTDNTWILRVPFQEFNPAVTQNWISKFETWPYLESFAVDAERELLAKFGGKPNLIIGNYSEGNLVASLLARRLNAIQCNIAHSLEKPKYLFSNLYWQDLESQYHFSAEFTADLISMNAADFILTSSYQEIVGTPESLGQYESYKCFTMPNLYHVIDGIDLFSPKFNRVPPGVNEQIFFPYHQIKNQDAAKNAGIQALVFEQQKPHIFGHLDQPKKRPMLAVSSMSAIKNVTGLVECFGRSLELQTHCNLILLTNALDVVTTSNSEEGREISKLHALIDQYRLHGHIRWLDVRLSTHDLGEAYRAIADRQGIFIHFAKFEAFGRTILEAMISGLPTFTTQFGGSLEIIQDGTNGFHINPTDLDGSAEKILQFFHQCDTHPEYWYEISNRAIQRIQEQYNWPVHTRQLLLLTKIYSFWNYIYSDNRHGLQCYLEALFYLLYKPRAELILAEHLKR
ncbi:sucrose synthase [Neosynechococcus sphagnicola sy1]|uniref:Sucrose synthase n=1 Tax=Neosynechococcus sphagnicola sy1 TaxID=1497020 RepID=A0A098TIG0_9CYAN|nr:sucrose synthase [Neosynechococcus sphagnicola]KGF71767.1 sucrose synthase [Neosynechococcus sphagnicola sy1]